MNFWYTKKLFVVVGLILGLCFGKFHKIVKRVSTSSIQDLKETFDFFKNDLPNCNLWSCEGGLAKNNTNYTRYCSCNDSCILFGDCCFDFYEKFVTAYGGFGDAEDMYRDRRTTDDPDILDRVVDLAAYGECIHVVNHHDKAEHYYMINSCPSDGSTDQEVKVKCENLSDYSVYNVPVTYKTKQNGVNKSSFSHLQIIYRNVFCAFCHNNTYSDLDFWKTWAVCPNISSSDSVNWRFEDIESTVLSECYLKHMIHQAYGIPRACSPMKFDDECRFSAYQTNRKIRDISPVNLCSRYLLPVQNVGNQMFRNIHCATCVEKDGIVDLNTSCILPGDINSEIHATPFIKTTSNSPETRPGITILFNFDELFGITMTTGDKTVHKNTQTCKVDEVYDLHVEKCRQLYCRNGLHPVNGTCVTNSSVYMPNTAECIGENCHITFLNVEITMASPVNSPREELIEHVVQTIEGISNTLTGKLLEYSYQNLSVQMETEEDNPFLILPKQKLENINCAMLNLCHTFVTEPQTSSQKDEGNSLAVPLYSLNASSLSNFRLHPQDSFSEYAKSTYFNFNLKFSENSSFPALLHDILQILSRFHRNISASLALGSVVVTNFDNKSLTCLNEIEVSRSFSFQKQDNETIVILDNLEKRRILDNTQIVVVLSFFKNYTETREIYMCNAYPDFTNLNCNERIAYSSDEYIVFNGSLYIQHSEFVYQEQVYEIYRSKAFVCSNFTRFYEKTITFFNFTTSQRLLSTITISISLVGLFLTLTIHVLFPNLRNLHGKNLISFSGTLFFAQLLTFMQRCDVLQLCISVAIMEHFLWLSVFCWMTTMAFDLARTFHVSSAIKLFSHMETGRYRKYALFSWGSSLIVVVICVSLEFLDTGFEIGYGRNGVCWISNPLASLCTFAIPVCVTLLLNIICFLITIYGIEKTKSISRRAKRRKEDKMRCFIYVKLSVLLGLTWTFGFLAAFLNSREVWYAFILLNGLQGFFIFVGFIVNTRVYKIIRKSTRKMNSSSTQLFNLDTADK